MRFLYNIVFTFFFLLSSPYYFLKMWRRGNWQRHFRQRFGKYSAKVKQAITNRHTIWIHAVSVGEVNLCTQLIRALEPRVPNLKFIVSTTTSTGMGELERKLPAHILRIYYPIDRQKYVRRALSALHPEAIILIEAEIWPNFLWHARSRGIPMFLVNARLSARSFRGYRWFGFLFRPIFAAFDGVGAQNQVDAGRLRALGCRPEAIHVVGSLKYDAAPLEERRSTDVPALLRRLGVHAGARLLVAGSTHAGEEAILAEQFLRLRKRFADLFLIVVPRHFERGKEAGRDLAARGVKFVYRSEITVNSNYAPGSVDCLLVNTTGELKYFYEHATVIFIGKSLTATGGQNPIEPGALGKAMVFGPNMQNFAAIASAFVSVGGAVQVGDAGELERSLGELLGDATRRDALGRNALQVVRENQGAIGRTVDMIVRHLEGGEMYVPPKKSVE
ncbi:MAG: 3-deoxy-D-manno-octulosonic acid transferase [Verrucomicrobia bacterium]|nr:3-deoxy-D-manno-octulosonic acid transferase [Verrucomicrobiota bacterium]